MEKDLEELLKEAGYLETPASRFFWRGATPTFRHHLRQVTLLSSMVVLPGAGLFAVLTRLSGWDRVWLFLTYLLAGLVIIAVLDLLIGTFFRFMPQGHRRPWINLIAIPAAVVFFAVFSWWLADAVRLPAIEIQLLIWASLCLTAGLAGGGLRLLFISRLFWQGIQPPNYRTYPMAMGIALLLLGVFAQVQTWENDALPRRDAVNQPPVMLLAFDLPQTLFEQATMGLPDWPRQTVDIAETDITAFWTSLGTGTTPQRHAASLVSYETPLFKGRLSAQDPTQVLPLRLFRMAGLATPVTEAGRYRKYFWEVLDDYGLRTHAYNYWHTFPAGSQNGGVISERWTPEYTEPPFISGIEITQEVEPLDLPLPEALMPTLARENQAWTQLYHRAVRADFDLCIAYFPLGDLLSNVTPGEHEMISSRLWAHRQRVLRGLLARLPQQTKFGIFIASGKAATVDRPIRWTILSNWFTEFADPFTSHLEMAPTILNAYGLPRDRYMPEARIKQATQLSRRTADYGEPQETRYVDPYSDSLYYEELKSLGYIR